MSFADQITKLEEPMSGVCDSNFDGYVTVEEVVGKDTVEFRICLYNEDDEQEAALTLREGPVVEGHQMAWVRPDDMIGNLEEDEWQLMPLIPRALVGLLAY